MFFGGGLWRPPPPILTLARPRVRWYVVEFWLGAALGENSAWFSLGFRSVFARFSLGVPLVFAWFSMGFRLVPALFSRDFPRIFDRY